MSFDVYRKVDLINWKFEWKIYDLDKHKDFMPQGQFLTSKQFFNPGCPSVIFEMRVYPKEYCSSTNSYRERVSLRQTGNISGTLKVRYNIYALDANFKRIEISDSKLQDFQNQTETSKFLIDMEKALHSDGSILLYCEVEFVPYNINCVTNIINGNSTIDTKHKLNHIYKLGINSDCILNIGTEKIYVHRNLLANNSEVFQKMFGQEDMIEAKNGEINIVDSSPECVNAMVEYFYNGEINKDILEKLAYKLFAIAHKYHVKSLMDKCEQMMSTQIAINNFVSYVYYLDLYNLPLLEKACIKFIATNRQTFLDSNEWKNCQELYMKKAIYLLESVLKNEF